MECACLCGGALSSRALDMRLFHILNDITKVKKISKMFDFEASRTRYRYPWNFQKPNVIQYSWQCGGHGIKRESLKNSSFNLESITARCAENNAERAIQSSEAMLWSCTICG
jgi:hypothetical protein